MRCGETLRMERWQWERLARKGAVVHEGCLGRRRALAQFEQARAVRTTMVGIRTGGGLR